MKRGLSGWQPLPRVNGEWGLAFASLGVGALACPIFMWFLRKSPESFSGFIWPRR